MLVEIDGGPATHDALHFRALTNYGHYTSMQVRDGRVRGWPPLEMAPHARSLRSVGYVRPMAHLKHIGTFAQIRYGDQARAAGFDDAVLVGPDTAVLETSIANIGVVDGGTVVWPDGAVLVGTGWQLLTDALSS